MSQPRPAGQAYLNTTIRSAKLPILTHRYAPTTHTTFSISARTPVLSQRQKICINDEILTGAKRNHIHSQAYRRGEAFKKIGRENDRLYKRINSQKSLYSQESMRKSTVSIKSASRCSSRESIGQGPNPRKNKTLDKPKQKKSINIELAQQNVQKMAKQDVIQFKNMFVGPATSKNQSKTRKQNISANSISFRPSSKQTKNKPVPMGNLLHRIAQQICQVPQLTQTHKRRKVKR